MRRVSVHSEDCNQEGQGQKEQAPIPRRKARRNRFYYPAASIDATYMMRRALFNDTSEDTFYVRPRRRLRRVKPESEPNQVDVTAAIAKAPQVARRAQVIYSEEEDYEKPSKATAVAATSPLKEPQFKESESQSKCEEMIIFDVPAARIDELLNPKQRTVPKQPEMTFYPKPEYTSGRSRQSSTVLHSALHNSDAGLKEAADLFASLKLGRMPLRNVEEDIPLAPVIVSFMKDRRRSVNPDQFKKEAEKAGEGYAPDIPFKDEWSEWSGDEDDAVIDAELE